MATADADGFIMLPSHGADGRPLSWAKITPSVEVDAFVLSFPPLCEIELQAADLGVLTNNAVSAMAQVAYGDLEKLQALRTWLYWLADCLVVERGTTAP